MHLYSISDTFLPKPYLSSKRFLFSVFTSFSSFFFFNSMLSNFVQPSVSSLGTLSSWWISTSHVLEELLQAENTSRLCRKLANTLIFSHFSFFDWKFRWPNGFNWIPLAASDCVHSPSKICSLFTSRHTFIWYSTRIFSFLPSFRKKNESKSYLRTKMHSCVVKRQNQKWQWCRRCLF